MHSAPCLASTGSRRRCVPASTGGNSHPCRAALGSGPSVLPLTLRTPRNCWRGHLGPCCRPTAGSPSQRYPADRARNPVVHTVMSCLLTLHQDATLTLATTERTVPAQQVQALESALDLAAALQTLTSSARDAAAQAQQAACEQGHRDTGTAGKRL